MSMNIFRLQTLNDIIGELLVIHDGLAVTIPYHESTVRLRNEITNLQDLAEEEAKDIQRENSE